MNNTVKEIKEAIEDARTIFIGSHVNPDGDNLGSSLAMLLALRNLNKDVKLLYVDSIPDNYNFLPGIELIEEPGHGEADLFIALDSADLERLGRNMDLAKRAKTLLNIDHHISNPNYGDLNLVNPRASSTCEIVYELLVDLNIDLNKDIATNLYTGISTDTGSFIYSNTSKKTHEIVASLYDFNINPEEINVNLYQNKSLEKTRLFSMALSNIELYFDNKLGLVVVDEELLTNSRASLEDTEGLVEEVRNINTIEVAVLLKISGNEIRVSTRSKSYVDVAKVCTSFNGGGHKRAAGCTIYGDIREAKDNLLKEIGMLI